MKNLFLIAATVIGTVFSGLAASPVYKSFSGAGNAAAPTTVIVPADPSSQFRLVSVNYQSDTNNGALTFSTGNGAFYETVTNATTGGGGATAVTNNINTTNGLIAGSVLVLQQSGTCYSSTLSSWGGTNGAYFVVLASGGWGVSAAANSDIYQMSTATSPYVVGASTNWLNGNALYVGNQGRPVLIKLSPANVTNQIINATGHYE